MTKVAADLDAELLEVADLLLDDLFRQTELGDAVDQHAAGLVQRLVDRDLVAAEREIGGARETGRSRADHRNLETGGRRQLGHLDFAALGHLPVGDKAFEPADGDWIALLAGDADDFTLVLLRADAAADGGQGVVLFDDRERAFEVGFLDLGDKTRDVDAHRAAVDALGFLALEATIGFEQGDVLRESQGHLAEVLDPVHGFLRRHRLPGDFHALLLLDLLSCHQLTSTPVRGPASVLLQVPLACDLLLLEVDALALHHEIEVDLVGVELGAVDADELAVAADRDPAAAAHPGAVDHDGVERHHGGDLVFLGHQRDELHHDGGADGDDEVRFPVLLDEGLERVGDDALAPEAAVIGGVDHLVRRLDHFGAEDDQTLVAAAEDGDDFVAGLFESAGDGQHGCDAGAAADAHAGAEVLDVRRPCRVGRPPGWGHRLSWCPSPWSTCRPPAPRE